MYLSFKLRFFKPWAVTDDKLIIDGVEYPLDIVRVHHHNESSGNGVMVYVGKELQTLGYANEDRASANQAVQYIREYSVKAEQKLAAETEVRMRCKVCGHVFCYNVQDIAKNMSNAKQASTYAKMGVLGALFGTRIDTYANTAQSQKALDKIVDFDRCPKCNSTQLEDITNEKASAQNSSTSSADEIKKFKELLDSGVITQEEFDTKKKQILGL